MMQRAARHRPGAQWMPISVKPLVYDMQPPKMMVNKWFNDMGTWLIIWLIDGYIQYVPFLKSWYHLDSIFFGGVTKKVYHLFSWVNIITFKCTELKGWIRPLSPTGCAKDRCFNWSVALPSVAGSGKTWWEFLISIVCTLSGRTKPEIGFLSGVAPKNAKRTLFVWNRIPKLTHDLVSQ